MTKYLCCALVLALAALLPASCELVDVDFNQATVHDVEVLKTSDEFALNHTKTKDYDASLESEQTDAFATDVTVSKLSQENITFSDEVKAVDLFQQVSNDWALIIMEKLGIVFEEEKSGNFSASKNGFDSGEKSSSGEIEQALTTTIDDDVELHTNHTFTGSEGISADEDGGFNVHHGGGVAHGKAVQLGKGLRGAVGKVVDLQSNMTLDDDGKWAQVYNITDGDVWEYAWKYGPVKLEVNYTRDIELNPYLTAGDPDHKPVGVDLDVDQTIDFDVKVTKNWKPDA